SSQINLSWTASTDNVGVFGYDIYRNGAKVGSSAAPSYSDTGLAASTAYTYTVDAYDAAGNTSAKSASVSKTTLALPTVVRIEAGDTASYTDTKGNVWAPDAFYTDGTGGGLVDRGAITISN